MVLISEWLPNPEGSDTKAEWVELRNDSNLSLDISGWRLTADGKKFFTLQGIMPPGAYVVLPRTETRVTLKNTDGKLALYDASGRLADQVFFLGNAPEGESANRSQSGSFFGKPTPGSINISSEKTGDILAYKNEYPLNTPLNASLPPIQHFGGSLLGTALALAATVVFILKSHEDLSHIFFETN